MSQSDPLDDPAAFLRSLFDAAVEAADPMKVVPPHLSGLSRGRLTVIGAGKASARMAEAVESTLGPCRGLVVTRYGYARDCAGIEIVEAGHPVPDIAGANATERMLRMVDGLEPEDTVLALISGGGSALLCAPAPGLTLADKIAVNGALLSSGAPIGEMNVLRKHLSRVKGGRLAAACHPARLITLMVSDVPGDDPGQIASGPTVGETSTPADALGIARHRGIELPGNVRAVLNDVSTVVPPSDPRLSRAETRIVAAASQSLAAASRVAKAAGVTVHQLGDSLEGEARDLGRDQARMALQARMQTEGPLLFLSGGEATVTRRGDGTGGPNAEFALAAALELDGAPGIHLLACDTDGVDGAAEIAGACIGPETIAGDRNAAAAALEANDAHTYFGSRESQVVTGPTLTNVNDFRAILVLPRTAT